MIRQVVGEAIVHSMHDPRIAMLTTVTRVEMTADLLIARVYLSVPEGGSVESLTLRAIQHAGGYLQRKVARQLTMRHCPELRFEIDQEAKGARHILELLAENRRNDPEMTPPDKPDEPEEGGQVPPDKGDPDAMTSNPEAGTLPDRSEETGA